MIEYSIAKQFTRKPGPRYKVQGPFSGEQFRDEVLTDLVRRAETEKDKVLIDLDGGYGYGSSFLEESFGGLVRSYGTKALELITFKSDEDAYLIADINRAITKELNRR